MITLTRRQLIGGLATSLAGCGPKPLDPTFPRAKACDASCVTVDAHCHAFNGSDLPIAAFLSHIAPLPRAWTRKTAERFHRLINQLAPSGQEESRALDALEASDALITADAAGGASAELEAAARALGAELELRLGTDPASVERVVAVARLISRPRHRVLAKLVQTYPTVDLFTPLLVDYAYFGEDDCERRPGSACQETPLHDQLAVHSRLSVLSMRGRMGRAAARVHPVAPFNPLREVREVMTGDGAYRPFGQDFTPGTPYDCAASTAPNPAPGAGSIAALRHAIENLGFIGAKIYPPVGFLPLNNASRDLLPAKDAAKLDLALHAFYAYCEAEQVPVTAHTASSNGYEIGYGILAEPKHWEPVLARYPELRLDLGHFGHLEGVIEGDERGVLACEAWCRQAASLMERYPNVYVDFANSPVPWEKGYAERFMPALARLFELYGRARQRVMYGSDWWLNELDANAGSFVDAFSDHFNKNFSGARAALMGNNALTFLGITKNDGTPDRTNRNRKRLEAFYERNAATKPAWLA